MSILEVFPEHFEDNFVDILVSVVKTEFAFFQMKIKSVFCKPSKAYKARLGEIPKDFSTINMRVFIGGRLNKNGGIMRKTLLALCSIMLLVVVSGCASKHMQVISPSEVNDTPTEHESSVVFMRVTSFGGGVQAPLGESIGSSVKFIGISSAWTKILYKTTPGKHIFFVGGESASMIEATLDPGKIYYVEVDPNMGVFKARFSLLPFDLNKIQSDSFNKDLVKCEWVVNGATAEQWFLENRASMEEKAKTAQEKFAKTEPEKQKRVLSNFGVERSIR